MITNPTTNTFTETNFNTDIVIIQNMSNNLYTQNCSYIETTNNNINQNNTTNNIEPFHDTRITSFNINNLNSNTQTHTKQIDSNNKFPNNLI